MHSSESAQKTLKQLFGFDAFRAGQQRVIDTILNGDSALAIFPTGSGKSLCYQYAATQLPHLTLVVSPLLALIKDQLDFLASKNIAAASIDSTLGPQEYGQVVSSLRSNQIKILMVSVERFKNERFRALIETLNISLLVIDEAHCMSEWGHNFRPDYLKLPQYKAALKIPRAMLLTATATRKVKLDMAQRFDIEPANIIQTGFYRANLDLNVLPVAESDKNNLLLQQLQNRTGQCGIVYVTLQKTAEDVTRFLRAQKLNAKAYHAGLEDDVRKQIQQEFMAGTTPTIVATIAFGMGIDKSDIRYVIHYNLPKSMENYSQEIGRAGRDGQASDCLVLASLDSLNTLENFIYGDTPELSGVKAVMANIQQHLQDSATANNHWEYQLYALSKLSNIRQLTLKTLIVQLELKGVITPLYSYVAEYQIKLLATQEAILERFEGERRQFLQSLFAHTRFKKTWGIVDIQALLVSYPSDRKRVVTALDYLKEKQLIGLKTSGVTDVCEVNPQQLAAPELASELFTRFKQHEASEIARIQQLINFLQSQHCLSHRLAAYFDDQNAPQACSHCSVCRGEIATLSNSSNAGEVAKDLLINKAGDFITGLQQRGIETISTALVTRFLTGISTPLFTQVKAKSLPGFAIAEKMRYQSVLALVTSDFGERLQE